MERKDIFTITISILAILLLLTTPINQEIKNLGNMITGFQVVEITEEDTSSSSSLEREISRDDREITREFLIEKYGEDTAASIIKKLTKAEETSLALRSPNIFAIINELEFSKTEKIIVTELGMDYLEKISTETQYTSTSSPKREIPEQVRLSMPKQNTDLILGIKNNTYPFINIEISVP